MDFFDKLGKTASNAYKLTADKTGKFAKETKIKFKIGELKNQISDIYEEIGQKVYENHIREEEVSIKKDLEEYCIKIDVLSDEIDGLLKQCMELKDKKMCPNCFKELQKDDNYCSNCGQKQEVEKLDDSFKGEQENEENEQEENDKNDENEENEQEENDKNEESEEKNKRNEENETELEKIAKIEINPEDN